jgi:hypothetical protein
MEVVAAKVVLVATALREIKTLHIRRVIIMPDAAIQIRQRLIIRIVIES